MHLTCLELELLLECVLPAVEGGLGGVFSLALLLWVILMTTEFSGGSSRSSNDGSTSLVVRGWRGEGTQTPNVPRLGTRTESSLFWEWLGVLKILLKVIHSFKQ